MAEHKYDGLLHATLTDKEIRQKPWYKERVREKFLKSTRQQELGKVIVAGNWTFVKSGLDDCRTGVPAKELNESPLVRNESGVQPMLVGEGRRGRMKPRGTQSKTSVRSEEMPYLPSDRASSTGSALDIKTAINRPLSDFEKRFSRKIPMQLRRLERVEAIEESIMQHKLSMFPHYEDSVPPEMFEEIMQILDPEVYASNKVESMRSQTAEREQTVTERNHTFESVLIDVPTSRSQTQTQTQIEEPDKTLTQTQTQTQTELAQDEDSDRPLNPYKWIAKRLEQEIRPRRKQDESFEKPEPTHTLPFTNDFCEWVKDIGGSDPSNNIKEQTLIGLFESGYETKPALSVPVQIVELSNIPPELRATAVQSAMKEARDGTKPSAEASSNGKKAWRGGVAPSGEGDEDAEFVKFRYGAWYLPTTLWKRMNADEPMRDPKEVQKEAMSEVKKRNLQIDTELAPMHCTKSFVEFAQKKGTRPPQFLNSALDIQKQKEDEKNRKELQMVKEAKRRALHDTLYGSAKTPVSKVDFDDASTVAK